MALGLVTFAVIFTLANIVFSFFSKRSIHSTGLDFLFYAPWLASINFGIYGAFKLAIVLSVVHAALNMRIAHFILMSFPAQLAAIALGYFLGVGGFWISLVIYLAASSVITYVSGGVGGRYVVFLVASAAFNILLFFVLQKMF